MVLALKTFEKHWFRVIQDCGSYIIILDISTNCVTNWACGMWKMWTFMRQAGSVGCIMGNGGSAVFGNTSQVCAALYLNVHFWKAAPISVLGAFGTSCKHLPLLCLQTAVHRPIFTFSSISLSALVFIQLPRGVPGSLADKWSHSVHQLADNFVCPPFGAEKVENDQFILFYFLGGAENILWCWK